MRPLTRTRTLNTVLVLTLATSVLALAWPRLRASLLYLPLDTALARYWDGRPIDDQQLHALVGRATHALAAHENYRYHDGLSVVHYARAQDLARPAEQRRASLEFAESHAITSLARAPLRPATWLRVAAARSALGREAETVVAPLVMSVYTGRVEPTLLMLRLQLLYAHRRQLDADGRRILADQTVLAWRLQPRELLNGIRSRTLPYEHVAGVLAPLNADALGEIDEALRAPVR